MNEFEVILEEIRMSNTTTLKLFGRDVAFVEMRDVERIINEHISAEDKHRDTRYPRNKMEREALQFIGDNKIILWVPSEFLLYGPKCDKCDKHRIITVKHGSDEISHEECDCKRKRSYVFKPKMMILFKIAEQKGEVYAWYIECSKKDYELYELSHAPCICANGRVIKEGVDFIDPRSSYTFFENYDACKRYCNQLNEKEALCDIKYKLNGELFDRE